MTRRAKRKKLQRKFKVGDLVTWGSGLVAHPVVEVLTQGVVVDLTTIVDTATNTARRSRSTSLSCAPLVSTKLIEFAPGSRSWRTPGPPRHWTKQAQDLAVKHERALLEAGRYPLGR